MNVQTNQPHTQSRTTKEIKMAEMYDIFEMWLQRNDIASINVQLCELQMYDTKEIEDCHRDTLNEVQFLINQLVQEYNSKLQY